MRRPCSTGRAKRGGIRLAKSFCITGTFKAICPCQFNSSPAWRICDVNLAIGALCCLVNKVAAMALSSASVASKNRSAALRDMSLATAWACFGEASNLPMTSKSPPKGVFGELMLPMTRSILTCSGIFCNQRCGSNIMMGVVSRLDCANWVSNVALAISILGSPPCHKSTRLYDNCIFSNCSCVS